MDDILTVIGLAFLVFVLIIALNFLGALATWWAWNTVIPYLFGLKAIGFIQAFALNILATLFFKSYTTLNSKK